MKDVVRFDQISEGLHDRECGDQSAEAVASSTLDETTSEDQRQQVSAAGDSSQDVERRGSWSSVERFLAPTPINSGITTPSDDIGFAKVPGYQPTLQTLSEAGKATDGAAAGSAQDSAKERPTERVSVSRPNSLLGLSKPEMPTAQAQIEAEVFDGSCEQRAEQEPAEGAEGSVSAAVHTEGTSAVEDALSTETSGLDEENVPSNLEAEHGEVEVTADDAIEDHTSDAHVEGQQGRDVSTDDAISSAVAQPEAADSAAMIPNVPSSGRAVAFISEAFRISSTITILILL